VRDIFVKCTRGNEASGFLKLNSLTPLLAQGRAVFKPEQIYFLIFWHAEVITCLN
jgi:hypothetical protein